MSIFSSILPADWQTVPLKNVTTIVSRGTAPDYSDEGMVRVVGQASNQFEGLDWGRTRFHASSDRNGHARSLLESGDVLVNSTGTGTLGRVGFFTSGPDERPCMADGHITIVRADGRVMLPKFLFYWLVGQPFQGYLNSALVNGATNQIELSRERLAAAPVPVIRLEEQRRIVDFLDDQVRRVNKIASARRHHRRLLDEHASCSLIQTIISSNETDRTPTRMKYLFTSVRNGTWGTEPTGGSADVTCVRVADFDRDAFTAGKDAPTRRSLASDELRVHRLARGDILLEKSGGGEKSPVGFAVTFDGDEPSVCSNFVAALRVVPHVNQRFACLVLAAHYRAQLNIPFIKQATGIQNLDSGQYLSQRISIPGSRRQSDLAAAYDRELDTVTDLKVSLDHQLVRLSERKEALIGAALTGRIDVTSARGVEA